MGEAFSHGFHAGEEQVSTLLTPEICVLTYEEFLALIGELNILTKKLLDSRGYQLVFAVRSETASTVFWKATVQIACVKIDSASQKIQTFRLLSLSQFLKVVKTMRSHVMAAEQSKSKLNDLTFSTFLSDTVEPSEPTNECIICFERKQEVMLPCAHSYCTRCIEEWNESHDTCPICRERLQNPNDAWVISEVPKAEEISNEIRENLLELTKDKPSSCNTS